MQRTALTGRALLARRTKESGWGLATQAYFLLRVVIACGMCPVAGQLAIGPAGEEIGFQHQLLVRRGEPASGLRCAATPVSDVTRMAVMEAACAPGSFEHSSASSLRLPVRAGALAGRGASRHCASSCLPGCCSTLRTTRAACRQSGAALSRTAS